MKQIRLNHWYVDDNALSISLLHYYVSINMYQIDDVISFRMRVIGSNMESIVFNFETLEEAINFTENYINKCNNLEEIIAIYNQQFCKIKLMIKRKLN